MDIREKFINTIERENLIEKNEGIVVGVSGGPDSICLLHLLWSIKEEYGLRLYVVHLDHQFRGEESKRDAEYVKEFCEKLGIPSFIYSVNVEEYSREKGVSFEEGGRQVRYSLYEEVRRVTKSQKIAVAQNSNDQAETLLMRLMRGSGLEGLSAIDYKREDGIIRPLLDISRAEIEDYCRRNNLNPRIDRTNYEAIYTRNKIRLELIPYIEKNFNANIIETLCRTANVIREENNFLEEFSRGIFKDIADLSQEEISIDMEGFKKLHIAIKKRVLRIAIERIKGDLKDIFSYHIDFAVDLINNGKVGTRIDLPRNIEIEIGYNNIYIKVRKGDTKDIVKYEYQLPFEGEVYIKEINSIIRTKTLPREGLESFRGDKKAIYIDRDKVKGSLIVRNRRPGDRFTPLGFKGRKKVKDYFIDEKIPREQRDMIPLVCDDDEILWIVGYRMGESCRIDDGTKTIVKIWLDSCSHG